MDQISNYYRQNRTSNYQDVKRENQLKEFQENCLKFSPQLRINIAELTADNIYSSQRSYSTAPEVKKLFPNFSEVVTPEKELIIRGYTSGVVYDDVYYAPSVSLLRLKKFFLEEWNDHSDRQQIDALVAYINISSDRQAQKLLSTLDLNPEYVEQLFNSKNTHESLRAKNNPFLLASFPQYYQTEEIENILKTYMISGTVPDYIGMSDEQINLRKRLDAVSREHLGVSLHELKNNNIDRFQKLYYFEPANRDAEDSIKLSDSDKTNLREELWHEYQDRFLQTCLQNKNFSRLQLYDAELTETQSPRKQKIFDFLDQNLTPENLFYLFDNRDYMVHCLKNGTLSDENLQNLGRKNENIVKIINAPELTDRQALILFQASAFNESAYIDQEESIQNYQTIREEYQRRFSKDFDTLTNEKGQNRAQFLIEQDWDKGRTSHSKELLNFHFDELMKLPIDRLLPYSGELSFSFKPDGEISYGSNNLSKFGKIYQTFGIDGFPKDKDGNLGFGLTYYMLYLYREKQLSPADTEVLKASIQKRDYFKEFEPLFNANGDTLYSVAELGTLIYEEKAESLNILTAGDIKFANEDEKYQTFNNLIAHYNSNDETDRKLTPFLQQISENKDFNFIKALDLKPNYGRKILAYVLNQEHPDLKMLQQVVHKLKSAGSDLYDSDYPRFLAAGLDIKFMPPQELISYRSGREIYLQESKHYQAYDFNRLWLCDEARHPSDGSKTTFLNEMCHYRHAEGAALALNHGADPAIAAEFMRGKYQKPPFQDLFIKTYFKKNATPSERRENINELRNFMLGIAAHLDEGKSDTLKQLWKSLDLGEGRPLSTNPEIRGLINDVNQAYAKRNFKAEKQAREEAARAEEKRQQAEKEARLERERQEQERRDLAEKARLRKEQLKQLNSRTAEALGDLTLLNETELATRMTEYLRENADKLPVTPNMEELESLKTDLLQQQINQQRDKKRLRQALIQRVETELREQIAQQEKETGKILAPSQIGLFAQEFYKEDSEAKTVLLESLKTLNEEAKDRQQQAAAKINAMKQFEIVTDQELARFYSNDAGSHEDGFFSAVGKDRRRRGYETITERVAKRLGLINSDDKDNWSSVEWKDYGNLLKKVIDHQQKRSEESREFEYQPEISEDAFNQAFEEASESLSETAAPTETPEERKAKLKAAKKAVKSGKPETTVTGLDGLAALKAKFGGNSGK